MDPSIYYEILWVLFLFVATATLREAVGELCVHIISKSILSCSHLRGKTLDVFISCSNGGRSLGFGSAWRMWNIDKIISNITIILPFCCWIIGMPIKLVAVSAVRGGNEIVGYWGTWLIGIIWIVICFSVKIISTIVDKYHGLKDKNLKIISYRKIFQLRFCKLESYGMMINPDEYDESDSYFIPKPSGGEPLGVDIYWENSLKIKLSRNNYIQI